MNWLREAKINASHRPWRRALCAALFAGALMCPNLGIAQDEQAAAPNAAEANAADADTQGAQLDPEALRVLVAPIALYPDDLVSVVLPASTTGLQIVQAQRYLDKHKTDSAAQPNSDWDPSVLALLNYPEVLARMNADLDWTARLGDAVINQQSDVMDAIQQIRNEAAASGYLKSDEKQVVTQEKETVIIKSADPEVIYVPTYDPQVVVQQTYVTAPPPVYTQPYPYYYSPAATFFTGAFIGAAFAYGMDWHNDDIDIDVNNNNSINNSFNSNRNFDSGKYNFGNKVTPYGNKTTWQGGNKRPSTQPAGRRPSGTAPVNRPGANGGGINGANRPAGGQAKPALSGQTKANQPKAGQVNKPANRPGNKPATAKSGSSLGSYTPGRQTAKESNRGQQSLSGQRAKSAPARPNATQRRPNQGAFGGSSAGSGAMRQQNRGNRSLGGRGGGGARRR